MSSKKLRFRPTVQTLETRRCLAGALGMDEVAATPEEPAISVGAVMAISVGAAMADDATSQLTAPEGQTKNEPYVSEIRMPTWTWPPATAEDDVIVDGKIITAENYDAANNGGATDAFFSDLGRDDTVDHDQKNWSNLESWSWGESSGGGGGGEHSNNFEEIK